MAMHCSHLLLVVPEVWLEAPEANLDRGEPRAAGGDVAAVVCVAICRVVHAPPQHVPCRQCCWRRVSAIPPPGICRYPTVHVHSLSPAQQ